MISRQQQKRQLLQEGFCRIPDILPAVFTRRLTSTTTRLAESSDAGSSRVFRTQGSMVRTHEDPIFAELIAWEPALAVLQNFAFGRTTFTDGYVISKPPRSPRLFWHYDWFAWDDDSAYADNPPQVFLMYYLSDTNRKNGCLRVIPGSHRRRNPLHDCLGNPHSEILSNPSDFCAPEFSDRTDELDVPVAAGDLLIGDARLLHATHANTTDTRRTVITLWYQPGFDKLPPRIQAQMVQKTHSVPQSWPAESQKMVQDLIPEYSGSTEPAGRTLYRPPTPDNIGGV